MNGQIKRWKAIYGNIFKTKIDRQEYVYRTLTVGECGKVLVCLKEERTTEAEDIALNAIIFPADIDVDKLSAGITKCLSDFILESSGIFTEDGFKKTLEMARKNVEQFMSDDLAQWKLILLKVFPGYTFDALNNLPIQELFNLVLLAEEITGQKFIESKEKKKSKNQSRPTPSTPESKVDLATDKFMSQRELELIAAEEATKNLQNHWKDHKKK